MAKKRITKRQNAGRAWRNARGTGGTEQTVPVIHYRVNHIRDDRPGAGPGAARRFWDVYEDIGNLCRKYGPVGPDDRDAGYDYDDFVFWVVEDQYNNERYHYVEVCRPEGMTKNWLLDLASLLKRKWPRWGVSVRIPAGHLMVFGDRLMVRGPTFRRCTTVRHLIALARKAMALETKVGQCRSDADLERLTQVPGIGKLPIALRDLKKVTDTGLSFLARLHGVRTVDLAGSQITDQGLAWLRSLSKLEDLVLERTKLTDAGLAHLHDLPRLEVLYLRGCRVTDAGLEYLAGLKKLELLYLNRTRITDDGLIHLRFLPRLRNLYLERCRITDAGLAHLGKLTRLEGLDLSGTKVSDAGLIHLRRLRRLKFLDLDGTKVTSAGAEAFQQALPTCRVSPDRE
ncbi:MAG TPA: hypothetical protein VMF69_08025 [Gemmataceae bacterium]|nr:hypothetical protein [Gemmataceae bacterium]